MTATITEPGTTGGQQPGLRVFKDLQQGSEEWLYQRCGVVTASVVGQLVSSRQPTAIETDCPECGAATSTPCVGKRSPGPLKTLHTARAAAARSLGRVLSADNDSETGRALTMHLAAQRITGWVEPTFTSASTERGTLDEPYARDAYSEHYAPAEEVGFMVRDFGWGKIGYSPDGLVGEDGLIEIKSRNQKIQLKTILADEVPLENMAQIQTGLLVSGRDWLDYVSYCGGMPLYVKRVYPDAKWFTAITEAVQAFEETVENMITTYEASVQGRPLTDRIDHFAEMDLF